jgi:NADH-quinone oxidoreductase subunit N
MSQFYTGTDNFVLIPALLLVLFGCATLLFDFLVFDDAGRRKLRPLMVVAAEVFVGYHLYRQQQFLATNTMPSLTAFGGALTIDGFALFFNWILVVATIVVAVVSYKYLEIAGEDHTEYYSLLLFAQCGMFFLVSGTDLVTLFIGLELMALSFYIMVGFLRGEKRSNEAAIKYLLLGAFSSGFLAYGFSVMYGISGSTRLADIAASISQRPAGDPVVFLALATTAVGLLFKISAVPFHMWAPDAYEGAPTTVTAYLSVASKAASIAFLLRIFIGPLVSIRAMWEPLLAVVAVATMTIGNLAAINQNNLKRLLAYSSISHAGYMLLGLIAGNSTGIMGVAVYVMVYTFMNLGAFLVIIALRRENIIGEDIDDIAGLMHKSPGYAVLMLIFLLSLAGIPPTAGFLGKYYIFLSLVETGHYVLAVIGTLYVAVAIYYYFRIVRSMFTREETAPEGLATSFGLRVALAASGLLTLGIGVFPEPFLRFAQVSLLSVAR